MSSCMNSRTNGERIMDALDLLDEDLAAEVQILREKKKKRPVLWRYGVTAACFVLVLLGAWRFLPLSDRVAEGDLAGGDISMENMGAPTSGTDGLGGNVPTVSADEECTIDTNEEVSADDGLTDTSMDFEGTECELPAVLVKINGRLGDTVLCTVVENDGLETFSVGSHVILRFDKWEGPTVTENTFSVGSVWSVTFDGYEGNILFAAGGYEWEE